MVQADEGTLYDCKVKGNFRLRGIRSTNPVAVGDRVSISPQPDGRSALIDDILDRRNYIIRRASNLSKQSHIIAANVDQAVLLVTIAHPETSTTFIDRFLASAEAYRVPVLLIFNKTDLYDTVERRRLDELCTLYSSLGYACRTCSALSGEGLDSVREALCGCVSLLSGNSGVGKSTLLNALLPEAEARTAEISSTHDSGMHTTTFSCNAKKWPIISAKSLPREPIADSATALILTSRAVPCARLSMRGVSLPPDTSATFPCSTIMMKISTDGRGRGTICSP